MQLDFSSPNQTLAQELADKYIELKGDSSPANFAIFNDFYSNLRVIFLERLIIKNTSLTTAIITRIDADYKLTETMDPEIKQRWFPIGIYLNYEPAITQAQLFVSQQGRLKYLNPMYIAMKDINLSEAQAWYNANIDFYHPLAIS